MVNSAFHSTKAVVSQVSALWMGLQACGDYHSFGLAKAYANHPWSVTEPEAVGVPGWQTGAKALSLQSIPTGL